METKRILLIVAVVVVVLVVLGVIMTMMRKPKQESPSASSSTSDSQSRHWTEAAAPKVEGIQLAVVDGETKVSWNPLPDADHYTMYYSTEQGFAKEKANVHNPITEPGANMASDVPMGYYFRVTATRNVNGTLVETPLSEEHFMQLGAAGNTA